MSEADQVDGMQHHVVPLEGCGSVSVYVQGDLEKLRESYVFLTVHDIGENHQSWVNFSMDPVMSEITGRVLYLHVDLPGQEPGAKDLATDFNYPTMQELGTHLVTVLDQLRVTRVVGIGNGAGGNVIARFAMMHPGRCHGVILLNTTAATSAAGAAVMKQIKDKVMGSGKSANTVNAKAINVRNVERFAEAYNRRSEFLSALNDKIKCDVLMVAGAKNKISQEADAMHQMMKPGMCSLLKMEDVSMPLEESLEKTAEAILLFCQGLGLLPTCTRKNSRSGSIVGKEGGRRMSMEQYDTPNIRRLSLSSA